MAILTLGPSHAGKQYSCLQVELKSINPTRLKLTWIFLECISQASKPRFRNTQLVCPGDATSSPVQIHTFIDAWESLNHVLPQNAYYQSFARYEYMDPVLHMDPEWRINPSGILTSMDHSTDTQTDRLNFGLTQAIGDHEPEYPGLSSTDSVPSTEWQQVFLKHIENGRVWRLARKWYNEMNSSVCLLFQSTKLTIANCKSEGTYDYFTSTITSNMHTVWPILKRKQTLMSWSQKEHGWGRELVLPQNNMDSPQFKCQLLRKVQLNNLQSDPSKVLKFKCHFFLHKNQKV